MKIFRPQKWCSLSVVVDFLAKYLIQKNSLMTKKKAEATMMVAQPTTYWNHSRPALLPSSQSAQLPLPCSHSTHTHACLFHMPQANQANYSSVWLEKMWIVTIVMHCTAFALHRHSSFFGKVLVNSSSLIIKFFGSFQCEVIKKLFLIVLLKSVTVQINVSLACSC